MFEICGLKHIIIHPFAYTLNYNDERISLESRRKLLYDETKSEIDWLTSRYEENRAIYNEHGFIDSDFSQLKASLEAKLEYVRMHLETDNSYEWRGGFNYIVTGIKE